MDFIQRYSGLKLYSLDGVLQLPKQRLKLMPIAMQLLQTVCLLDSLTMLDPAE